MFRQADKISRESCSESVQQSFIRKIFVWYPCKSKTYLSSNTGGRFKESGRGRVQNDTLQTNTSVKVLEE